MRTQLASAAVVIAAVLSLPAISEHRGNPLKGHAPSPTKKHPDPVREDDPTRLAARRDDPRWYCKDGKIFEHRYDYMNSVKTEDNEAYDKSLPQDEKLAELLVDAMDLPPEEAFLRLDQIFRKYRVGANRAAVSRMLLNTCVENVDNAVCAYYADVVESDAGKVRPKTSCKMALAYSHSKQHDWKAQDYVKDCNDEVIKKIVATRLDAFAGENPLFPLLKWGLSSNPWDVDRYSRLLLAMDYGKRNEIVTVFQKTFGVSINECDLLHPAKFLEEPTLLAKMLSTPKLAEQALASLQKKPMALRDLLTKDRSLEEALLPHFTVPGNNALFRLLKDLPPQMQHRIEEISRITKSLPPPASKLTFEIPVVPKEQGSDIEARAAFGVPKSFARAMQQLELPDWTCKPPPTSAREIAKQAIRSDPQLSQDWKGLSAGIENQINIHASNLHQDWVSGKISSVQFALGLDWLQGGIPIETALKQRLRELALAVAPTEFHHAMKTVYSAGETSGFKPIREILPIAFSDETGMQFYRQLLLQLPSHSFIDLPIFKKSSDEEISCPLVSVLQNNWQVTANIMKLADFKPHNTASLPTVVKLATLGEKPVKAEAERILLQKGAAAVPFLLDEMRVDNIGALNFLGEFGEQAEVAIPTLIKLLHHEELPWKRGAIAALGKIGPKAKDAGPILLELFSGKDFQAELVPVIVNIGHDPDKIVPALMGATLHFGVSQAYVDNHIALLRKKAVPALTKMLSSQSPNEQIRAAKILEEIGPDAAEAIPALIKIYSEPKHWEVREAVLRALGKLKSKEMIPKLIEILESREDRLKVDAMVALRELGPAGAAAVPSLKKMLASKNAYELHCALTALQAIGAKEARAEVEDLIESDNEVIAAVAVRTFSSIRPRPENLFRVLEKALGSEAGDLRKAAMSELAILGEDAVPAKKALLALLEDKQWEDLATKTLATIGPSVLPDLEKILNEHPNEHVRANAAYALLQMKEAAAPAMESIFKRFKADSYAHIEHVAALGEKAVPELKKTFLKDPKTRDPAILALTKIGEKAESAVPQLISILETDPAEKHRSRAARALEKIRGRPDLAVPALIKALDSVSSRQAGESLAAYGPKAKAAIPKLIAMVEAQNDLSADAAHALGLFGAEAAPALKALRNSVRVDTGIRLRAIDNIERALLDSVLKK